MNGHVRRVQELRRSNAATPVPGKRYEPAAEVELGACVTHGVQEVRECGSSPGFTGALIFWETLACGCQLVDTSADTLKAVE